MPWRLKVIGSTVLEEMGSDRSLFLTAFPHPLSVIIQLLWKTEKASLNNPYLTMCNEGWKVLFHSIPPLTSFPPKQVSYNLLMDTALVLKSIAIMDILSFSWPASKPPAYSPLWGIVSLSQKVAFKSSFPSVFLELQRPSFHSNFKSPMSVITRESLNPNVTRWFWGIKC